MKKQNWNINLLIIFTGVNLYQEVSLHVPELRDDPAWIAQILSGTSSLYLSDDDLEDLYRL